MSDQRVPPNNLEAERSVLGGILLKASAICDIETLSPDDFYDPKHRAIFEAMKELEGRSAIDPVTLAAQLDRHGKLAAVGGMTALGDMLGGVPSADNIVHYANIVRDKAIIRRLIVTSAEVAAKGYLAGDAGEYLDDSEKAIYACTERRDTKGAEHIEPVLKRVFQNLDSRFKNAGGITGIATNFTDLDVITAGLQPSDLVILAARPSMGKTAFALSIAENAGIQNKTPVMVFSLEMSSAQLAERVLCSQSRVDSQVLRRGIGLERHHMRSLTDAAARIAEAPITIDDQPAPTVNEIRSRCRRWKMNRNLFPDPTKPGLIIVDYLQLMRGQSTKSSSNREQEISEISRGLKALAKELACPVLALSQLSRKCEERTDKRPMMSDLRESGAIEQDADVIMFIYREEVYAKESTPEDRKGVAEIIISKQRNGPIGTVELSFIGRHTRFDNLSRRQEAA